MPITQLSATHSLSPSLFIFQPYPIQLNKDLWHRWIHRMSRVKMPSIYRFSFAPRRTTFVRDTQLRQKCDDGCAFQFCSMAQGADFGCCSFSATRAHTVWMESHIFWSIFTIRFANGYYYLVCEEIKSAHRHFPTILFIRQYRRIYADATMNGYVCGVRMLSC